MLWMKKYQKYLMDQFIKWEKSTKQRKSYSSFARYLGVKQSALSQWLNGYHPPSKEYIDILANRLGYEIYDVLDMRRPDEFWVPSALLEKIQTAQAELKKQMQSSGISDVNSPEGIKLAIEVFKQFGCEFEDTPIENSE